MTGICTAGIVTGVLLRSRAGVFPIREQIVRAFTSVRLSAGKDGLVVKQARQNDQLSRDIGAAIRARRTSQGVTMQVLADRAGLSQPFLSKVERGMAQLSMRALDRVVKALGTTAVGLFGGLATDHGVEILRSADRPELPTFDDGNAVSHALSLRPGQLRAMEFVGGPPEFPDPPYMHRNDSLSIVVEGTYEFIAGGERYVLKKGDTLSASGGVPQTYRVLKEPARMMLIIVSEDVQVVADPPPKPKRTRVTSRPSAAASPRRLGSVGSMTTHQEVRYAGR